jgi:DNA-binding transcriptional MerR regulator
MHDERSYTIGELAHEAGVTPRTVRYYTAEGLLPQPDTRGRYARYSHSHLERLEQIARLKEQYLPLHVIRERLAGEATTGTPSSTTAPVPSPLSLGRIRASTQQTPSLRAGDEPTGEHVREEAEAMLGSVLPAASGQPLQLGTYQFFPDLPEPPESLDSEMSPAPERWQRVVVAPGVELHFREPLSPERRRRLEALIAAARDQLRRDEA